MSYFFSSSQFSSCSVSRWHIDGNSFRLQWKIYSFLTQSLSSAPSHTFPLCQLRCSRNSAGCILNFPPTFIRTPPDRGLTPRWLWKQHPPFPFSKERCAGHVHSLYKFTNIFVVTTGKKWVKVSCCNHGANHHHMWLITHTYLAIIKNLKILLFWTPTSILLRYSETHLFTPRGL